MLAITARLFDENGKLVGYAVTDGQQTKQLSRLDTWNYAKQKMIMNVTASGDVNDPTISGTNGFELKKLPEIRANKTEAKQFTTQTLTAIMLRNLISGRLNTSENVKELNEQAKQQLKEEVTSGKLDKNRLGCLSEDIVIKNVLVYNTTTNVAVGYRIQYTGQEPINTYRMSPIDKQMEAFTIQPNTVVNLNRAETALLASLPEVGCKFNRSKLVLTNKRIGGDDLYETLNKFFISYDEGGISDKCVDIHSVEKPDIIDKYFKYDGQTRTPINITITKQILDMLKIKNALGNKSIDVNEQSVKDAIASGQLDISRVDKQSENITVVRTLTDANSHVATTQIIGYQILYKGTEPIETYRVSPVDKQLTPFVINPSDKICLNRMEMAILASKEEVGCKFSNGILTKSSKGNQVNDLHAWLNSWYFALNDSHGATVYDMALPIQSVETPETIRKYFLTTGERTAQQKQAINNATGLKGLMGAFKR